MIDGAEAIQLMRKHAKEWGFDKNNVGYHGLLCRRASGVNLNGK